MRDDVFLRRRSRTRLRARIFGIALTLALVIGLLAPTAEAAEPGLEPGGEPATRSRAERMREGGPGERRARREAMRGLVRALPDARPVERLAILRQAMRLPFEERRALRERLRRFDALDPHERRVLVAELEVLRVEGAADVDRLERNFERWENLSPEERERYRAQLRRLRDMPLEERRRLLDAWERSGRGAGAVPGPESEPEPGSD